MATKTNSKPASASTKIGNLELKESRTKSWNRTVPSSSYGVVPAEEDPYEEELNKSADKEFYAQVVKKCQSKGLSLSKQNSNKKSFYKVYRDGIPVSNPLFTLQDVEFFLEHFKAL